MPRKPAPTRTGATRGAARPTVAMLLEQENRADKFSDLADQHKSEKLKAEAEVHHLAAELDKLRAATEPESQALAGCVQAIEAMFAAERSSRGLSSYRDGVATMAPSYRPEAHHSAVGRILLHLAYRYGVPLVPPAPEPEPETVLVQAPGHLAPALRGLLGQ